MMSLDREQDKEGDEKERRTIGKSCPVVSTVTTPSLSLAATTRKDIMPRTRPDIAPTVQPHMFAFFQTMAQATGTTADPIKQPIWRKKGRRDVSRNDDEEGFEGVKEKTNERVEVSHRDPDEVEDTPAKTHE
jgi:hypothetical protein